MRPNFINEKTGEYFHVTSHRLVIDLHGARNVDPYGNEIVDPKTKEPLKGLSFDERPDDVDFTSIVTKGSARSEMGSEERTKALSHFRERANKHLRSDEGKHQRLKSINREIDSMNKSKGGADRKD